MRRTANSWKQQAEATLFGHFSSLIKRISSIVRRPNFGSVADDSKPRILKLSPETPSQTSAPTRSKQAVATAAAAGGNPLGLPSRLNSALHRLARDLFEDMPSVSSASTMSSRRSLVPTGSSIDETPQQSPIFITQMGGQQRGPGELVFDFERRRSDSRRREKEQAARKQQVDRALTSIYKLLDGRRATGQPHLRSVNSRRQASDSVDAGVANVESQEAQDDQDDVDSLDDKPVSFSTCRTAESLQILTDARRRRVVVTRRRLNRSDSVDEQQVAV